MATEQSNDEHPTDGAGGAPAATGAAPAPLLGAASSEGGAGVLSLVDLEERARGLLTPAAYGYYAGGAETETTLREAPAAWGSWRLRPRVLRGVTALEPGSRGLGTTLLGSDVRTPIGVAPWAYQGMAHPDGELGTAAGAAAAGALMTVSTSANHSQAAVAAVQPGSPKWFQLYRLHSPAYTDDLARRAAQAGYRALVLTVDLPVLGRRLRDVGADTSAHAHLRMANHPPVHGPAPGLAAIQSPSWTFDDVSRFADVSGLPVVVKGVLRGDDAALCVQAGASAVWVSTHGGRQADPAVASAHALPEVVDAVGDDVEVYVDGGIRHGSDVAVALALGATAVFVGRPTIWGLATGGAAGVTAVLDGLTAELASTLTLCGVSGVRSVPRDTVVRVR
ncbi:alpha-hydroxy-acid oxidizing protein [Modestobacter sp. I12A-02628]|uniref:Alpha-hydroxy-acid oxidizing protein n=1 Tax=Goekera deserti TaxID=2497753 RepID=A0A7K3WAI1_9ACTN|nr:alpha-hydroxy acid oxidase [Goekera deserti]MPQ97682.1 alpha-hydroxy-acid oxidizing protein [Goekera deserti]NDI47651.1 alpha-hydroxy-acid oxidizing protein [Goekera deserti]NDI47714.1 alpha-hydroxy-acid oxidizing protein [Goekera deserti]NEL53462.1 alpha-hydroxy-acid oxidizing protein [Goekera deserti]